MAEKRNPSAQTTVVVEPGTFGNNSPEAITVKYPEAHRFNVTGQTDAFMTAERVFEALHGMSSAKLVNTAVASFIGFTGELTETKERGPRSTATVKTKTGVEIAEKDAKVNLLELFQLANTEGALTDGQKARQADLLKAMGLNKAAAAAMGIA